MAELIMRNCNQIALSRYLDGTLDDLDERLDFLEHIWSCRYCRDRVYEARKMDGWVRKYKGRKPANGEPAVKQEEDTVTNRSRMMDYLAKYPRSTVAEIQAGTGLKSSSISAAMKNFVDKGEVDRYTDGNFWRYSLPNSKAEMKAPTPQQQQAAVERSEPSACVGEGEGEKVPTGVNRAFPWLNGFKVTTSAEREVYFPTPEPPAVRTSGYLVPTNELDPECEAIRVICEALKGMDSSAVRRIVIYVQMRFEFRRACDAKKAEEEGAA